MKQKDNNEINIDELEQKQNLKEIAEEVGICKKAYKTLSDAYHEYVNLHGELRAFLEEYDDTIHYQSYLANKYSLKNFYKEIIIGRDYE